MWLDQSGTGSNDNERTLNNLQGIQLPFDKIFEWFGFIVLMAYQPL